MNLEELDFEACIEQIEKLIKRVEKRFDKRTAEMSISTVVQQFFNTLIKPHYKAKDSKEKYNSCIDVIKAVRPNWLETSGSPYSYNTIIKGMVKKHATRFIKEHGYI